MKILLTGASGFVGGHLLDALIKVFGSASVVAFTSKKIAKVNCVIYGGPRAFNVESYDFSEFTHLIHAGAFTPKNNRQSNDIGFCNDNIWFTESILNLNFERLKRVIYLSTLDVYGASGLVSEVSSIKPVSLYGASKFYCEELIKSFAENKQIEYMNLRVGHVYGPGEDKYQKILPLAINKILAGRPVEMWGDGSERRSLIYIGDVVRAIINAIYYEPANLDVNVVSGSSISIHDLLVRLIKISGKDVILNSVDSSHVRRDLVFDNSRLVATLLDRETSLDEGLMEEYSYMKKKYENNI